PLPRATTVVDALSPVMANATKGPMRRGRSAVGAPGGARALEAVTPRSPARSRTPHRRAFEASHERPPTVAGRIPAHSSGRGGHLPVRSGERAHQRSEPW